MFWSEHVKDGSRDIVEFPFNKKNFQCGDFSLVAMWEILDWGMSEAFMAEV